MATTTFLRPAPKRSLITRSPPCGILPPRRSERSRYLSAPKIVTGMCSTSLHTVEGELALPDGTILQLSAGIGLPPECPSRLWRARTSGDARELAALIFEGLYHGAHRPQRMDLTLMQPDSSRAKLLQEIQIVAHHDYNSSLVQEMTHPFV